MGKKQTSPELSQAKLPLTQEEQVPANPLSRKRQLDSDDDDAEPPAKQARTTGPTSKPARLTRQNLARFNKIGKKQTSDPSDDSGSTKTLSTTASGFAIRARENGILDPFSSKPPMNLEEIHRRLARTRATASPPESVYEDYAHIVGTAPNEATIVIEASGKLLKEYPSKGYKKAFNQAFTGYPKDVGFNNGLSAPQPDFIEGVEAEEYRPFPIDRHVRGAVLYKDNPRSVTLPYIAGEWKGPDGSIAEARMQAAYDGAALVYARNQALDAAEEPHLAGYAKVTTFTTDGTNLNLFAHYAAETEDGTLEYHQYPIKSLNLVGSHEGYKEGRKHLRNAQDLAREESYALRDELKDYWKQPRDSLHPIAEGVPPLSIPDLEPLDTTHAYEDEDDYEVVEPQPVYQPTPPTSSKPKHSKSHHSHSYNSHSTPRSSKAPSSTHGSTASSGQKRKASSSQESSSSSARHKYKSYWKKDVSGRYYHKHSDGTVSWLDDEEDKRAYSVSVISNDDDGNVIALKLERASKGNLRHFIEEAPRIPSMSQRLEMAVALAKCVVYLHSRGVIWGDLSTRNVLVFDDDSFKICDFASSALENVYPQFGTHTYEPGYCPALPEDEVRTLSMMQQELYALGSAVYEITAWKFPYADISGDIWDIVESGTMPVIADNNVARDIITRCWNFEYDSARAVADDLAAVSGRLTNK